jgi:hypothetical protein
VRHDRVDKPGERQASLGRRLLTGNDELASGGRVRQRPPPDSSSLPEDAPGPFADPAGPVIQHADGPFLCAG